MSIPLFLIARLFTHLNGVLVLVVVAKKSVYAELILEAHWEGFVLIWEINEDILLVRLCELHEILLELFWLRFLNCLWNHNHSFLELLLLNVDRIIFQLDDT